MPTGRPPKVPPGGVTIRLLVAPVIITELDAYAGELQRQRPGIEVTRYDAARALFTAWCRQRQGERAARRKHAARRS